MSKELEQFENSLSLEENMEGETYTELQNRFEQRTHQWQQNQTPYNYSPNYYHRQTWWQNDRYRQQYFNHWNKTPSRNNFQNGQFGRPRFRSQHFGNRQIFNSDQHEIRTPVRNFEFSNDKWKRGEQQKKIVVKATARMGGSVTLAPGVETTVKVFPSSNMLAPKLTFESNNWLKNKQIQCEKQEVRGDSRTILLKVLNMSTRWFRLYQNQNIGTLRRECDAPGVGANADSYLKSKMRQELPETTELTLDVPDNVPVCKTNLLTQIETEKPVYLQEVKLRRRFVHPLDLEDGPQNVRSKPVVEQEQNMPTSSPHAQISQHTDIDGWGQEVTMPPSTMEQKDAKTTMQDAKPEEFFTGQNIPTNLTETLTADMTGALMSGKDVPNIPGAKNIIQGYSGNALVCSFSCLIFLFLSLICSIEIVLQVGSKQ